MATKGDHLAESRQARQTQEGLEVIVENGDEQPYTGWPPTETLFNSLGGDAAGIGSVYVQGLTLDELRSELEARYAEAFGPGLAVSPQLSERATSYVFMGGEVRTPGRYVLEGPTTVMQAISMAGSWNVGACLRGIVVFRRDDNWCLMATKLNMQAALFGKRPCPADEIWIRDSDVILVPQSPILATDNLIDLVFTRGIYGIMPFGTSWSWSSLTGSTVVR